MGCCGSCVTPGCQGGCGCSGSPCNPISQSCPPSFTCSPCPPAGCCPSSPSPYYAGVPTCVENHCNEIITNNFSTSICTISQFNIPGCNEVAYVYFNGIINIIVGTFLYNPSYGYFEIVAFNGQTGQIALRNRCDEGNASPGQSVPACSCFLVVPEPTALGALNEIQDFTSANQTGSINTALSSLISNEIELVFPNVSLAKNVYVHIDIVYNATWTLSTGTTLLHHEIQTNINGGGYTAMEANLSTVTIASDGYQSWQLCSFYIATIAAAATLSFKIRGIIQNVSGTTNVSVSRLQVIGRGIGNLV